MAVIHRLTDIGASRNLDLLRVEANPHIPDDISGDPGLAAVGITA